MSAWTPKSVYLLVSALLPLVVAVFLIVSGANTTEEIAAIVSLLNSTAATGVALFNPPATGLFSKRASRRSKR